LFNYSTREITAKVVYYGPGLCGKTTNLQYVHANLPDQVRGKMLSLATKTDRTLFFDFLPIDLGEIRGMKTRVQLYTVPGQVFYNETRKLVLKGADGIVFVADSQEAMLGANVESYKNLEENLKGHGLQLAEMPHVIQFNKRDLPRLASIEDLNGAINKYNAPFYESVAVTGIGVQDTLKAIVKLVLLHLTKKYDPKGALAADERPAQVAVPAARPAMAVAAAPPPVSMNRQAEAPAPTANAGIPLTPFRQDEIEGLVDEVDDTYALGTGTADRSARQAEPSLDGARGDVAAATGLGGGFEVDRGFDPEWKPKPMPAHEALGGASSDERETPMGVSERAGSGVVLTEVVDDASLFEDPNLEIATLDPGQAREIVVPVQLGEGVDMRRFKLSIRLRLDPLD
jgi:signal recognition particle receptor subunit beta